MPRLAYSLVLLAACGGTPSERPDAGPDGGALQMNDVSILFPLGGAPSSYLAASDQGARGVLLPERLYDAVGHITGTGGPVTPGGSGDAAYADLHVVAVRLDPCFAALAPDPHGDGCDAQLRVIFQEVKDDGAGGATTFDSGLHAFYKLSRADLLEAARAIASVRAASAPGEELGGLAPHPIMARQGLDGAMARGVRAIVLRYAGAQNLTRVTELSATETGFAWSFAGFDVTDATAATFTPMIIPTLAGSESQSFFRGFLEGGARRAHALEIAGQFNPATTSADGFTPLADEGQAAQLTVEARQAAFDGLTRVDNPTKNSPDTIDCASCHLATPVAQMIAAPQFGLREVDDAFAFRADGRYVSPADMTPTFDPNGPFQIHAFSYVDKTPAINQRTVNETAAIVAYLNAL